MSHLERLGFNDRADAAAVCGGVWRMCEHAGLGGQCREYGPGRGKVSSAAIAGDSGGGGASARVPRGRPRAMLYALSGFGGRSFVVDGAVVANLDRTGFNDRASSLRIEGGYWMFRADAAFQGTRRTFFAAVGHQRQDLVRAADPRAVFVPRSAGLASAG